MMLHIFSSPEPMAPGELLGWNSSRRPSVRRSCHTFKHEYLSWPIKIKFYLEHHWGDGKAALGLGLDRISALVLMATDSSHRVIMGKIF